MRVNFDRYVISHGFKKVRHFSKEFDSIADIAKFIYDNRQTACDNRGRLRAIYLSKQSGLTGRELKILCNKYSALYERKESWDAK